jgi:type IV secretory pathway ATPase VirB11/archaellum biosynthesis ATPase
MDSIDGNIREFMKSEKIEKICLNRKTNDISSYKDSTITFEFDYIPFFARKRILLFKLNSSLNIESIIDQIPVKEIVKKIDENYLYIEIKNPSFGQ